MIYSYSLSYLHKGSNLNAEGRSEKGSKEDRLGEKSKAKERADKGKNVIHLLMES